ncbi:ABC transporter permease [Frankia sp. R43]|uniref:ABC transporter permease n=1 Tax=Frankia sp. R43 TaxID=269536 RepID=UPI0006CA53D1|nr:ABC transporter permease [Frankia sp. R43]KPM56557.1 ABC transporter permease [Frankia sp. R43]
MHEFLVFTISGLTTAGIYAITASGLTLTYVTTGVFNVAHGATGMIAAFAYWQLRVGWGWPTPVALLLCVCVLAPALGILIERLVMRRLDGTSPTTRLMATVALLVSLLSAAQWIWDPSDFRALSELFPGSGFTVAGVAVPYDDVLVLGLAALVAAGLWALLHFTRVGVAMRAVVDDRTLTVLNGARPTATSRLAWAVGTSLAALAGILVAPKLTLSAIPLTLLIVNAYAAAVIGGLRSLPLTFVGALVVGLANDYGIGYLPKIHTGAQYLTGLVAIIPVVVLALALLVLPSSRPRGRPAARIREITPSPSWPAAGLLVAGTLLGAAIAVTTVTEADLFSSTQMWGLGIVGLSVVPLVGYAGQTSLCQLSFAGIGAVVVAHAGADGNPLSLLLAAAVTALVGALVSLPALRLSAIFLALLTGAFAVALDGWIFQLPAFTVFGHRFDLFDAGSLTFTRFHAFGVDTAGTRPYFVFGAVVFCLVILGLVALRRSDLGQRLIARKESPTACATIGVNLRTTNLAVFTLSAAIAGLGGGIYAAGLQSATPETFTFVTGLTVLLIVVVAGVSSLGSGLAVALLLGTSSLSNAFGGDATRITATAVGLSAIALAANPNGLIPGFLRPAFAPVARAPGVAVAGLGVLVLLWAARLVDLIDGYSLVLGVLLLAAAVPVLAAMVAGSRLAARQDGPSSGTGGLPDGGLSEPLEWLGLRGQVGRADIAAVDRALGLPEVAHARP